MAEQYTHSPWRCGCDAAAHAPIKTEPWPYEPLPLVTDCPVCHGARWACGHTPIEKLTQIELLTRDNRILSQAVDSPRDLTTEHGAKLSELQRLLVETQTALIDSNNLILQLQAILISGKHA